MSRMGKAKRAKSKRDVGPPPLPGPPAAMMRPHPPEDSPEEGAETAQAVVATDSAALLGFEH